MAEGVDALVESDPAVRAVWTSKGAIAAAVAAILAGVYAVEGGYVNDARDPGRATSYGVTEQVARDYGYRGDMRRFPRHCDGPATICADTVYVRSYIAGPGYMPLVEIEPAVAGELIDTAVNMGPRRPNRWYRLTMNALGGARLPDSAAALGPADVAAYRMLQAKLGAVRACAATLDALDARQAAEYRRLAGRNPRLRAFLRGVDAEPDWQCRSAIVRQGRWPMGFLIALALGWKWPGWAARLFGWAVPILVVFAAVGAVIALIYHKGEIAGGAKVQVQAEKAHTKSVAAARADERQAQATVDAIGKRVAAADDKTDILVQTKIKEMHDALDATPGTLAGNSGPAAPVDVNGVRDHLNALIVDADRSADTADAER